MQDGYSWKVSTSSFSTNGDGVWQRNAYTYEGISFDNGHPDVNSAYHNHIDPTCLYTKSSSTHSPLIGWMLDGYPLYGPYGYTTTASSAIKRITTGYSKRTDMGSTRTTLQSCTTSGSCTSTPASSAGPPISTTYPIGNMIQDWVWNTGSDLGFTFL